MKYISNGKMVKLPVWKLQKRVECQCPHFATERKFTKKPSYCKQVFLQECVPFCKMPVFFINLNHTTKTSVFPDI